jgi:hypothetical protein
VRTRETLDLPDGPAAPSESNPVFRLTDTVTSTAMRAGSAVRHARVFHPRGVAYRGTVEIRPSGSAGRPTLDVPLLDDGGSFSALLRFSRGASLPEPLPDVLGVAVRILDAHGSGQDQDLLLGSSFELPLARQLLLPAFAISGSTLSSVLPYRLGTAGTVVFGARLQGQDGRPLAHLPALTAAIEAGEVHLDLRYASRFGRWHPFADVRIGEQLPVEEADALRFNVDEKTGGGIQPQGWWQALRRHAYTASQAARPR